MENNFKFYNTLTRQIDTVVPRVDGKIGMYTCGPTVYHFAHIGNIRSYIMEDVLEKALRYVGYDVKRVMNITDVGHLSSDGDTGEDKMLKGAKREHKSVMEVANEYTDAFFKDFTAVHNRMPDVVEPATNCIPEFIHMVEVLIEKGYAYFAGGNVYFDTSKLDDYFVFSSAVEKEQLQVAGSTTSGILLCTAVKSLKKASVYSFATSMTLLCSRFAPFSILSSPVSPSLERCPTSVIFMTRFTS